MTLNLTDITVEELLTNSSKDLYEFQAKLNAAIEQRKVKDKVEFQNEMQELATKRGFSLGEILGTSKKTKTVKKSKVAKLAKYRNPANDKETWAGRGRKPNWLLELITEGKSLEEFAI